MLRTFTLLTTMLVALAGCSVVSGERSLNQYTDDASITASVKSQLIRSNEVPASRVSVETDKGVVLLSGFVTNNSQKQAAERIAGSTKGVKKVVNSLKTTK